MVNFLIIVALVLILFSLGSGLYFLVRDGGQSERTVVALSVRVSLSVILLALLAWGFVSQVAPAGG